MQDIRATIASVAAEEGIDPAYALATAERESGFNPNAHASKSIYGLFQMSGKLRQEYGVPYGATPEQQVRGFAAFTRDLRDDMTRHLGRTPSNGELYLGHYWGAGRAATAINGGKVSFTPQELAANPELAKAGAGAAGTIMADIDRRTGRYGGLQVASNGPLDFSTFGEPDEDSAQPQQAPAPKNGPLDFSTFGEPDEDSAQPQQAPAPKNGMDFASFGKPESVDFSQFGHEPQPVSDTAGLDSPNNDANIGQRAGQEVHPHHYGAVQPAAFMNGIPATDEYGDPLAEPKVDRTPQSLIDRSIIPPPFVPPDRQLPEPQPISI